MIVVVRSGLMTTVQDLGRPGLARYGIPPSGAADPVSLRAGLWSSWCAIGLKLGSPRSARLVLGWEVRRSTPDFVLLGARSRIGMPAELLLKRHQGMLLFDTFVQHGNPVARAVWAAVELTHPTVARRVLEDGGRRIREKGGNR